jgi:hypothetical protein
MGIIFLFLYYQPDRRSFLKMLLFGSVFLGGIVILYFASNVSIGMFLEQFLGEVGSAPNIKRALTVYSTIFSFAAAYFILLGLIELYKLRNWRLICLSLIAPIPLMLSYGVELDSPKKILYAVVLRLVNIYLLPHTK